MLKQQDVKEAIRELKDEFKEYRLSDIKALDYLLLSNRDKRHLNDILEFH